MFPDKQGDVKYKFKVMSTLLHSVMLLWNNACGRHKILEISVEPAQIKKFGVD